MRHLVIFLALVMFTGCGGTVAYARPNRHHSWRQHHRVRQYRPARHQRHWRLYHRSRYHRVRYYTPTVYAQEAWVNPQYWEVPEEPAETHPEGTADDREFFYGDVMAQAPQATPDQAPQPALAAAETGQQDKADAAYERATDALKILKRLQAKQQQQEKGGNR